MEREIQKKASGCISTALKLIGIIVVIFIAIGIIMTITYSDGYKPAYDGWIIYESKKVKFLTPVELKTEIGNEILEIDKKLKNYEVSYFIDKKTNLLVTHFYAEYKDEFDSEFKPDVKRIGNINQAVDMLGGVVRKLSIQKHKMENNNEILVSSGYIAVNGKESVSSMPNNFPFQSISISKDKTYNHILSISLKFDTIPSDYSNQLINSVEYDGKTILQ